MQTQISSWIGLMGEPIERTYILDPEEKLHLTSDEREEFKAECRQHLLNEADEILDYYDAFLRADGAIICRDTARAWKFYERTDREDADLREELGMIDFSEQWEPYAALSEERE